MSEKVKNRERAEPGAVDWARIRAEYINGSESLAEIALRFGVPESTVRKHSTKGRWGEARKATQEKIADKVSEELTEKKVKETVRRVEKCYKAADRLITKINRAIREVDKGQYCAESHEYKRQRKTSADEDGEGFEITEKHLTRELRMQTYDTLVDTGKVSDIARSLSQLAQVLAGADDVKTNEGGGIIEIPAMTELDPPKEEDEGADNGSGS